jgi:Mrp family chromosome partitioning ATPase
MVDGMLVVVRQNYCDRVVLEDTIRQFEFVNARILGVVTTCSGTNGARYSKRYYKRYYSKYEGSYASSAKARSANWPASEDKQ